MKSILAVVSGSASRSHERLAAESIRSHAARRGYSVTFDFGDRAPASAEDVAAAELVIIASDAPVDEVRFASKRLFHTQTAEAIFNTDRILDECSVNEPVVTPPPRPNTSEAIVK